jgi:DDE superfamily endonuclease
MRKGQHKPLRTPGTNSKVWISGALNFRTGRFHWVTAERKNDELSMKLLDRLRSTYRCHKQLHLATDNDSSHTSKRVEQYMEDSRVGAFSCIRYLHGAPRAILWNWCGGLCTRR